MLLISASDADISIIGNRVITILRSLDSTINEIDGRSTPLIATWLQRKIGSFDDL